MKDHLLDIEEELKYTSNKKLKLCMSVASAVVIGTYIYLLLKGYKLQWYSGLLANSLNIINIFIPNRSKRKNW